MADPDSVMLACALRYAMEFGLRVVPILPGTKRPAMDDWPRRATTDPNTITEGWTNGYAGDGIGIATGEGSDVWVLDVDDNGNDKHGRQVLHQLVQEHDPLPLTPTVLTPSGGMHLYWKWSGPLKDKLTNWLDIRGEGRQVLAPPSVHPNGGTYLWHPDYRPSRMQFSTAPDWLLEMALLREQRQQPQTGDDLFADNLIAGGWTLDHYDQLGNCHWVRPGKNPRDGSSATVYPWPDHHITVWSTSVPGVETNRPYGPHEFARALGLEPPPPTPNEAERLGRIHIVPVTISDLLDEDEPEYDWLVPGLLERGDRFVLTGPEGHGKSTFLRQTGLGVAAGINPLATSMTEQTHEPQTVLLLDLENSRKQLRREFTKLLAAAPEAAQAGLDRFYLVPRSEGIVLDNPKDPYGDREWLEELIAELGIDFLVGGPVYKAIEGDPTDELPNRSFVMWLDRLRVRYGLTIMLEAHTPHTAARPYGWSGWKRWPEFGFHLHQDGKLEPWRGQREERAWPKRLERGEDTGWLWRPSHAEDSPASADRDEQAIEGAKLIVLDMLRGVASLDDDLGQESWKSRDEIAEWVGKRRRAVLSAVARLAQSGTLLKERRGEGRAAFDVFRIHPRMR